jgi:hypothetical protein
LAVAGVCAVGQTAQAASFNGLFFKDSTNEEVAEDVSAEYISNGGTGTNDYKADRTIAVDDVIRGGFTIDNINGNSIATAPFGTNFDEWGGAFSIKVLSVTEVDATPDGSTTDQDWTIVFGADPNFDDWLNAIIPTKGDGMVAGTAIRMWEDSTPDRDFLEPFGGGLTEDADGHVATAMDGAFYWDLGFGVRGSTWIATNSALLAPSGLSGNLSGSPANFELTLMKISGIAVNVLLGGTTGNITGTPVDFNGSTQVKGAGADLTVAGPAQTAEEAGFHATDNATLGFVSTPLPPAAWSGMALLSILGLARARRARKQNA